jgi:hypothetical protein
MWLLMLRERPPNRVTPLLVNPPIWLDEAGERHIVSEHANRGGGLAPRLVGAEQQRQPGWVGRPQ